ncbi:unnamed protein product [Adineta ricciae]|uniref:Apple domain-containing protein n=1 Tax=Adineta ricciae TaxID=249248 RepID=A0A815EEI6_ADIRI|nr:unnamed protein product [Adineta ricciae]CAF1308967.1 unnamed protein product [Adineta ricciae]
MDMISTDFMSYIHVYDSGVNYIPTDPVELICIHSSVLSLVQCAVLCHKDARCHTFVSDLPSCRLYESSPQTGSLVSSASHDTIVGSIIYDNIDLTSKYNQSCDHCAQDRYLVCRNGTCQCPVQTYWTNQTCQSQSFTGAPCNSSKQCRNDLGLVCSRENKTCTPMSVVRIPVIGGTLPAQFSNLGIELNTTGDEWWRAFDNNIYTIWNPHSYLVPAYLWITFDDKYLLSSFQLTIYGDAWHDPKTIYVYLDENAMYLGQLFTYPAINNGTYYLTLSPSLFNITNNPLATNQLLLMINPWETNQVWGCEFTFFGGLY